MVESSKSGSVRGGGERSPLPTSITFPPFADARLSGYNLRFESPVKKVQIRSKTRGCPTFSMFVKKGAKSCLQQ
jgi:hypothetical protein